MAQVSSEVLLKRAVSGEEKASDVVNALVDRDKATMRIPEGQLLDFKRGLDLQSPRSVGELAKDVLGFSNARGGLLLIGVDDQGEILGHPTVDTALMRGRVGEYVGTKVIYDVSNGIVRAQGKNLPVTVIVVPRTTSNRPNLLRQDVELRRGVLQKVKYLKGSLPYRDGDETKVVAPGDELAEVARSLGFTFVAPRTRSSFLIIEDRPGIRLFDHINDRFVGREEELATLLNQFEDARGRGVSIGGLGGIGKTELAIDLVARLHQQKRFTRIYSGSAKRILLTPLGPQQADPEFYDYATFLRDLAGWLGLETTSLDIPALETACLKALRAGGPTILLVDNLETIEDRRLIEFLDIKLPPNVWRVVTSRVHRIKNYVYVYNLGEMKPRDAAHLLRIELRRQGLEDLAATDINALERVAEQLLYHPLAIRWFAWACARDRSIWTRGPGELPKTDLEEFCVGHTLGNLHPDAVDVLAAIAVSQGHTDVDNAVVMAVAEKRADITDAALYELESAGLITVATSQETGRTTFGVLQLAMSPIRDLVRERGREAALAARLRAYMYRPLLTGADPLVRDLVNIEVTAIRRMEPEEIQELLRRIERAKKTAGGFVLELTHLEAECERQLNNVLTAHDKYREAAEHVLANPAILQSERFQRLLIEAATVAARVGVMQAHPSQIVTYLEALPNDHVAPLRVPGMLCEAYAHIGNTAKYEHHGRVLLERLDHNRGTYTEEQREGATAALARAEQALKRKP